MVTGKSIERVEPFFEHRDPKGTVFDTRLAVEIVPPMCAVCGRPVERIIQERDILTGETILVVKCHGASETVTIATEEIIAATAIRMGTAFGGNQLEGDEPPQLPEPTLCQDAYQDKPGCLNVADPAYTMHFDEVEPGAVIHWCSACGPEAHKIQAAIEKAFRERPGFAEQFEAAIVEAEQDLKDRSS